MADQLITENLPRRTGHWDEDKVGETEDHKLQAKVVVGVA